MKILHITPHLGGGVGRVILGYIGKDRSLFQHSHTVACLDYANKNAVLAASETGFLLRDEMSKKKHELMKMIKESDVVLMHWWNHPLLYDILVRKKLPPCRLIMWSHIAGFAPPNVFTKKILRYPDFFVFTTPMSFEAEEIKSLSAAEQRSLRAVWSTGGIDRFLKLKPKKHSGFNIGYIGTVDYAKLNPRFLDICKRLDIPEAKFIVCGGPSEAEIKNEAEKLGIADKFIFTGHAEDIEKYLRIFDVFGYPLAPYHYGTCDQSLQESMASGVPPVVLENRMESYMVKNAVTGMVAATGEDWTGAVKDLHRDKKLRVMLSGNARQYAEENFSIEKTVKDWENIFEEAASMPKIPRNWKGLAGVKNITASDVFLEALGEYGEDFRRHLGSKSKSAKKFAAKKIADLGLLPFWQARTKGTVYHYHTFFPKDKYLALWSNYMTYAKSSIKS